MLSHEELHDQIRAAHNQRRYEEAAAMAAAALEAKPEEARLWELLGIARHALRDFVGARAALERATLLAPLTPGAEVALAGCYLVSGQRDLAHSMYLHLATRPQVPPSLWRSIAASLSHVGELHWALELHRRWALEHPYDDNALFTVTHYMRLAGYPDELVLPIAERAFRLEPARIRNRVLLALTYHHLGDAAHAYRLVAAVDIDTVIRGCCPRKLLGLLNLFVAMGDEARREACVRRLTEIDETRRRCG
ncbi:MAG: hypothetical protein ABFD16_29065 [Thermoguttaceae bacterium]